MTSVAVYKLISLLVGLGFAYMGYRLFMANIWGDTGTVSGEYKNTKFLFKRAAPGTFFAVAGAVIVVTTILRGFEVVPVSSSNSSTGQLDSPPALPVVSPLSEE